MSHYSNFLDLTASFANVNAPTNFSVFDSDIIFQSDANGMVKLVYTKLGGNILNVELTNKDVYSCLEESALEYSATVNTYHAKSVLADIIGSTTGTLAGNEQKNPRMTLSLAKRRAEVYSSEALVGGTRTLFSSSIDVKTGQQHYDLTPLLSASGQVLPGDRAEIREIFHFSPTAAYRFFDTTSAINYLHNEFSFESFTPETVFYILPIWEDVLRAQQLEQSHRVRRSNYSFNLVNNLLTIYPVPTVDVRLYFTFYKLGASDNLFDYANDPFVNGVSTLNNVPFGNLTYSQINSIGRNWIRRFAFCLSKEVLGQVRSKVGEVPIPNGSLNLNGDNLIISSREEQTILRQELKDFLESMTYDSLMRKEAEQAQNLRTQLLSIPMPIFVGSLLMSFFVKGIQF